MIKKKQLRGDKLLKAIDDSLRNLAKDNENYVYNASELSRIVGCSRPTLDSKQEHIEKVLEEVGAIKRTKYEHPVVEQMSNKIQSLENENSSLLKKLEAFRRHHIDIYSNLYTHSADVAYLLQPILESEAISTKQCLLCGQEINEFHSFPKENKIIPFIKMNHLNTDD